MVVVRENTALFCCVKYRGCFLFQSISTTSKQKPKLWELNCKKEFGCKRTSDLLSSAQGVLGRMSYGKSARGKHLPLVWGGRDDNLSLQASSPMFQPRSSPTGQFLLFAVFRQKSNHVTSLTSDVLIPALLLGEIFQGTESCLTLLLLKSSASMGCSRNPTQGEHPTLGVSFILLLWDLSPGRAITQGLGQPLSRSKV